MADGSITINDSGGIARAVDAQTVGTDFQQTVTIGNGATPGLVAAVDTDGSLAVETNKSTIVNLSNVTSTLTSTTIVAARATRRGCIIFNDSTSPLLISYGTTAASASAFSVKIAAGASYFLDVPLWVGAITGLWTGTANGAARVTDLSA